MRLSILCLTISLFALTTQGCSVGRSDWDWGRQGSIEGRKNVIIERLIPEDGLPISRRVRLVEATIAVLREGEREQLMNLKTLRATLRETSLPNLERIEADYKARLANAE